MKYPIYFILPLAIHFLPERSAMVLIYTRNVLLSAQMGERASVVLICIITSQRAHTLKLFCMYDKRFEISKKK